MLSLFMLMIESHYPLQGIPAESHPCKLVGSRGSKNRYFDFEKLAEVRISSEGILLSLVFS